MKRTLVGLMTLVLWLSGTMVLSAAAYAPDNPNHPDYWEQYPWPHEVLSCHYSEGDSPFGTVVVDDEGREGVMIVEFDPVGFAPATEWEGIVVKGGSVDVGHGPGNEVYVHPVPGVIYYPPLNAAGEPSGVSHWILCKGIQTVVTTTTMAPTTTTVGPSTTTSTPPSTTVTTTSLPPVETTQPPEVELPEIWCEWENRDASTGAHEPIISNWPDIWRDIVYGEYEMTYVVYDRQGSFLGSAEFGATTPGRHDSWVSDSTVPVPDDGFIVDFVVNGVVIDVLDDPTCVTPNPPTTSTVIIDPPPDTEPPEEPPTEGVCVEDETSSTGWRWVDGETDGDECLPFNGFEAGDFIPWGIGGLTAGAVLVLGSDLYVGWRRLEDWDVVA